MKICENQCWLVVCIPISGEFNPQGLQISLFVAVRSCQSFWLFKTLCIQMSEVEDGYLITLIFFWYVCVYTIHIYILYCIYYTIIYVYIHIYIISPVLSRAMAGRGTQPFKSSTARRWETPNVQFLLLTNPGNAWQVLVENPKF